MYYFLFIIYLTIICYFIPRIGFIKKAGLQSSTIRGLFLLKIFVGVAWGFINNKYSNGSSDILAFNNWGWEEYQVMVHNPKLFVTNLFTSGYNNYDNLFGSVGSYWNDLEANIIIKFLAIFNIISRGNYYVNSIFFNFFCFFGHIAIYRIFAHIFKDKKTAALIGCFLLPSTLLFTSGIGKDNVIFTLFSLFSYCVYFLLQKKYTTRRVLMALIAFAGMLFIRNHIAFIILPALLALVVSHKLTLSPVKIFIGIYAVAVMIFGVLSLSTSLNIAAVIAHKQKDFLDLPVARTQIPMDTLLPSTNGLLVNFPQAINHGFIRPYLWESENLFDFLIALELLFYILIFVLFVFFIKKPAYQSQPFILYGLAVAFSILLLNGYIVPNYNSLVRYRSIFLPFLITPLLCNLSNSMRINNTLTSKIYK